VAHSPRPPPWPRNCALRTFLAPRGQVPCYGTWRKSLDLPALPVLSVVQPLDPAACWSLRHHQPQYRLLPTPFCRVEPSLDQVPLERLHAGLRDWVAPMKRSWRRHCLADVSAHDAVVLRALRGRLSTKSKLRRRGSRLRSLRSPHRSLPLRWLIALLPGSSKRRCNSRQRSRLWKRGRKHRVWAAPDAKTYWPTDPPPIPPRYKGKVLRTKTGVGSVSAT